MYHNAVPASSPPSTCATQYPGSSLAGRRPPATAPSVTAGLKCPPEM
ncbi:Uncharacterised protein [Mycobacteroides abscessus subsp. abscessus]|nr:Uncharacterised protein [Mycobacteroides abscessus subsp. abscessus]